jgi:ABC-type sugar transport system substrate-binding protein
MKKKISLGLVVLVVLAVMAAPAFAKGLTIGVVIPYEGGWFTAFHAGFQLVADANGDKIVWAYHNYKAEDEGKAVENLLARGVDVINVTAVSPESAEYSCRLANEAKVPIQITESGIASGKGKPFADVDFNWFDVYKTVANGLRKDVKGDMSVVWLQGFLGTPPVIQGIKGFKDQIATLKGIKLATDVQDGHQAVAGHQQDPRRIRPEVQRGHRRMPGDHGWNHPGAEGRECPPQQRDRCHRQRRPHRHQELQRRQP